MGRRIALDNTGSIPLVEKPAINFVIRISFSPFMAFVILSDRSDFFQSGGKQKGFILHGISATGLFGSWPTLRQLIAKRMV
jgi:hypothetical protein